VHVLGKFSYDGQCIIDNSKNMIILHPDHLISATVVADSFGCIRRAILQDRVKATGQASPPQFYGTIMHSVFQEALKRNTWDIDTLDGLLTDLLPLYYETIAEINLNENQIREHLSPRLLEMGAWAKVFVQRAPQPEAVVQGRHGQQSRVSINKLLDVEEHIWSPNYGLKGNLDATVQIQLDDDAGEHKTLTVPLELKTGKRTSEAHHGQTALYTLLASDRYGKFELGVSLDRTCTDTV
jgi:DNA replication ATP-dependent helicase Dna2